MTPDFPRLLAGIMTLLGGMSFALAQTLPPPGAAGAPTPPATNPSATAGTPAAAPAPTAPPPKPAGIESRDLKRQKCGSPHSPASLARDAQRTVFAIQLLDYCNDPKIGDDFLQQQFAKLSRITGREENCATVKALFSGECDPHPANATQAATGTPAAGTGTP